MSNHKIACIVLALITLLMAVGVNKVRGKAVVAREAAETARNQAKSAEQQRKIAEIKLKNVDARTAELRKLYSEWLPHFNAFKNTGDGEQRIAEVIREGDVFVISQKFKSKKVDDGDLIASALSADLVIEDEYTKVMNWLGKIEEHIPSSRVTKCVITRGDRGNDIHMDLQLQVPVIKQTAQ